MKTTGDASGRLGWVHLLLGVQSVVIILLSLNRLSSLTTAYVSGNEFLRWTELNNMIFLPLISLVAFYLLKKHLEYDSRERNSRRHLALNVAFLVGVYLLGTSYGNHEVTNYLNSRFCGLDNLSQFCEIVAFNDDQFSHWIFFLGFILVNSSLMLLQVLFPWDDSIPLIDLGFLVLNGLILGAGVVANLAFEATGFDLEVVALLALLALYLLWRYRAQPLLIYYAVAFVLGVAATGIVTLLIA